MDRTGTGMPAKVIFRFGCRGMLAVALAVGIAACAANGPTIGNADGPLATSSARPDQSAAKVEPLPDLAEPTSQPSGAGDKRAPVKVGLMLPLSAPGQVALIAASMKRAAEMAVFDFETANLQLVVKDDKGSPEGAQSAADELVKGGAEIVLGPLFGKSVTAVTSVTRAANVPIISFSNDRQVAGQGVHLLSFLASAEVDAVVSHAARAGKRRFAAIVPNDAHGKTLDETFRAAVARQGGTVVVTKFYPAQPNGMLDPVRQLHTEMSAIEEHGDPIDALFVPGGEDVLVTLGPLLRQVEINPQRIKILGTGGLDYANAGRDPMFVGAWFAAPDPRGWQTFSDKYARSFGHAPPRIASLAYDAVSLTAALSSGAVGARFTPATLNRASGFMGVDGQFRFAADGTVERTLAVLEVQKIGATVVSASDRDSGDRLAVPQVPQAIGSQKNAALGNERRN
jgi:branched-chain amino acid transport system substrate-binding protein